MNKLAISIATATLMTIACSCTTENKVLEHAIRVAGAQLEYQAAAFDTLGSYPRSFDGAEYHRTKHDDWTCGFFPGSLWLEYQLTGDDEFKDLAEKYTARIEDVTTRTGTHDLGFMTFCSFGNQYEALHDTTSAKIIVASADTLIKRFNPEVGLIRSWDFGKWNYPVIIDNMMNLEMLFWASEYTGNPVYKEIAITHADNTMKNHFRPDFSSYHVVSYNDDGSVEQKGTYQGLADNSDWARGQAWGLYGYTMCYRYTKYMKYLEHAGHIADFIMGNASIPSDHIPYWDYDATEDLRPRDASAAAITASALIEMSQYTEGDRSTKCMNYAKSILKSLSSKEYLALPGTNGGFILMHSTGAASLGSEIDVAISYADYYYLEAILRLRNAEERN